MLSYPEELWYVDGFAGLDIGPTSGPDGNRYPTYDLGLHAWCVNKLALVVDPSWNPDGNYYMGIAIRRQLVREHLDSKNQRGAVHQSYLNEWHELTKEERLAMKQELKDWCGAT
ncbi:MAG: hypothetical protein ACK4XJ_11215 [Fimbriimonadaceae bacterium]